MLNSLRDEGHTLEPVSDEAGVEERCGTPHGWDAGRGRGVDDGAEWTMARSGRWCGVDDGAEWTMGWMRTRHRAKCSWDTTKWGRLRVRCRARTKERRLGGKCIVNPAWICGPSKIGLTHSVLSFLPSHSHTAPGRHAEYNEEQSPEYE